MSESPRSPGMVLRWVAALPLAVGAGAIASILFIKLDHLTMLANGLDPNTLGPKVFTEFAAGGVMGAVFVWVAARVAPSSRKLAASAATAIALFCTAGVSFYDLAAQTDRGELSAAGAALGAVLVAYVGFRREEADSGALQQK